MPSKGFYITTAIDYLNGPPHVGHAYEKIGADIMARFHRLRGEEVLFATGSDENAPKVAAAAAAQGKAPQQWVDELAALFEAAWKELEISYDVFIRTTEPRHRVGVQTLFRTLRDRGDIYKGTYEGWYCQTEETYFALEETREGRDDAGNAIRLCPNADCGRPLQLTREENYFFALSKYTDRLLAHYEAHPEFVEPEFRRNEVVQFIRQGLRDMTISRKAAGWGIPVPDDESQVLYIWFDALINYLTVCGYPEGRVTGQGSGVRESTAPAADPHWWPADWHLVGKDILVRFHATLWPAMLMGAGLPLPRQIFGHGHLTIEGERMSKTRGNVLDPVQVARDLAERSGASFKVAVDAVRYHLYREMPHGADGDVALAGLLTRYNADLANDLGNALNRALTMVARGFDGVVPAPVETPDARRQTPAERGSAQQPPTPDDARLATDLPPLAAEVVAECEAAFAEFRIQQALLAAWRLVSGINKYIGEQAPWELARRGETAAQGAVLYQALEGVRIASVLLAPVMPTVAAEMQRQLGAGPEATTWDSLRRWGGLRPGTPIGEPAPIFPRIDLKKAPDARRQTPATGGSATQETPSAPPPTPNSQLPSPETITIDDFAKLDLRVAEVLSAERVAGADKLLQLRVSLGTEERTVLAGVAPFYDPASLVGRKIVLIANLAPRKMRGIVSHGMILAADAGEDGGGAAILSPDKDVPPGARVR